MINTQSERDGATALLAAVPDSLAPRHSSRHYQVVLELLAYGADVSLTNKDGFNALHLASRGGHADLARLFLKAGADVFASTSNSEKKTAIELAEHHIDTRETLRQFMRSIQAAPHVANSKLEQYYSSFSVVSLSFDLIFVSLFSKTIRKRIRTISED